MPLAENAAEPTLKRARRDLFGEPSRDKSRHLGVAAPEAMVTALDVVEGHGARDERQGRFKLSWGAEGVSAARDEQARQVEAPEVVGSHVVGPAGRVERVADEHEAGGRETSATAMLHIRPPMERPPRKIRPGARTLPAANEAASFATVEIRTVGRSGARRPAKV